MACKALNINFVGIAVTVKRVLFEGLPDLVRLPLVPHPVFAHQHPEVNIASTVRLATSDASIEDDAKNVVKFLQYRLCRSLHRAVELRLRDSEIGVLWNGQPVTVDLYEPTRPVAFLDDEVVVGKDIDRLGNGRSCVVDCLCKVRY